MAIQRLRASGMIRLSELGAIAECLAAIGAMEQLSQLIEAKLLTPREEDLDQQFSTWHRAPKEGEPPFQFVMGSPKGETGRFDRWETQVDVRLSAAFFVATSSVTYGMWCLMAAKPDHAKRWGKDARLPVTHVSWFEASLYVRWLDHWLRKLLPSVIPAGHRVALPTEAQREFFARAGTVTRFWPGDDEQQLEEVAWLFRNSDLRLHPVGSRMANGWGIRDVHGNLREWCRDWFQEELRGETDPLGPKRGLARVLRGGSYWDYAEYSRSAQRYRNSPDDANGDAGFRLVLSVPEPVLGARQVPGSGSPPHAMA
ncbi:MAG: formylglycine-generating enzyme family protein [Planctomycetes bacterium]|nr:formylglycine-generating enzyme family protein [Planctomycetota bacterium]